MCSCNSFQARAEFAGAAGLVAVKSLKDKVQLSPHLRQDATGVVDVGVILEVVREVKIVDEGVSQGPWRTKGTDELEAEMVVVGAVATTMMMILRKKEGREEGKVVNGLARGAGMWSRIGKDTVHPGRKMRQNDKCLRS